MKITELINKLESFKEKHGDVEIMRWQNEDENELNIASPIFSIWHKKSKNAKEEYESIAVLV